MKPGSLSIEGRKAYYIHNGVAKTPCIVLLHGRHQSAKSWVDNGTMKVLADNGYSAISLHLPSYGQSLDTDLWPHVWLMEVMNRMKIKTPVIVAASIAGEYAVPYMINNPKRISGLVAVALTHVREYKDLYNKVEIPILSVCGELDRPECQTEGKIFSEAVKNGEYRLIPKAGHAPYMDKPEEFNAMMLELIKKCTIVE
jgi:pimeloyl-ACP methyl ester carboxylesterase